MVIGLLLSLMSCDQKSGTTPGQGPIMSLVDSIPIPEPSFLYHSAVLDMAIDDSGSFYMSDNATRRIVQTGPPFDTYRVLGGPGMGPGEYLAPWFLDVSQGYLFYSNLGNSFIKSMNIQHNTVTKTQDISAMAAISHVRVY